MAKAKWILVVSFILIAMNLWAGGSNEKKPTGKRQLSVSSSGRKWLVMLYQDADDYQLEQDIFFDMNEAEKIGSTKEVTIVSQLDRYKGGFDGDGDWSDTRRILLSADSSMESSRSDIVGNLGEVNMADGDSLADFCIWAMQTYPADHYAVILSDHGSGWPGGWSDPDPDEGDMLWVFEMSEAFTKILDSTSVEKLDLIGFDACLMGHVEVFHSMSPYTKYVVASQETEPGIGWAYSGFLHDLTQNPVMDGAGLSKSIVDSYLIKDESLISYYGKNDSDYLSFLASDTTLSAIDTTSLDNFRIAFNSLLEKLQGIDQSLVAKARTYAQSYTNIFDESQPSPYVDIGHFLKLVKKDLINKELVASIDDVLSVLKSTVIAEVHGELKSGSTGMSIHFPNSMVYQADWGGMESYAYAVPDFINDFYWDEFLLYHYTGTEFEVSAEALLTPGKTPEITSVPMDKKTPAPELTQSPVINDQIVIPDDQTEIIPPGRGLIQISNLQLDKNQISYEDIAVLSADISGTNIAYIYIAVYYYNRELNQMLFADMDFIESDSSYEVEGVHYPDWSEEGELFYLEFEWEPILFSLDDGSSATFALLEPVDYGKDSDSAIYKVQGTYYSADKFDTRYAVMYMNGKGFMTEIYGYSGAQGLGAPHEITPKADDLFSPLETWIVWDDDGTNYQETRQGEYLKFGKNGIEWYDYDAPAGEYYIGFVVQDFDGNLVEEYLPIQLVE